MWYERDLTLFHMRHTWTRVFCSYNYIHMRNENLYKIQNLFMAVIMVFKEVISHLLFINIRGVYTQSVYVFRGIIVVCIYSYDWVSSYIRARKRAVVNHVWKALVFILSRKHWSLWCCLSHNKSQCEKELNNIISFYLY